MLRKVVCLFVFLPVFLLSSCATRQGYQVYDATGNRKAAWQNALGKIEGATLLDVVPLIHEGEPAVISDMAVSRPKEGQLPYTRERMMMVYYRGRMVSLSCGVAGESHYRQGVEQLFEANKGTVCQAYFDSLHFRDEAKEDQDPEGKQGR